MRTYLFLVALVALAAQSDAAMGRANAKAAECLRKLADASSLCSNCLNGANKIAYTRLDRVFSARGNGAFRLDVSRFFRLAVSFSQDTVKTPAPCCKVAAEIFSKGWQDECACLPEVVQHTKWFDKDLLDYYYNFLTTSCRIDADKAEKFKPCAAPSDETTGGFLYKAQEATFAVPDWVDKLTTAGRAHVKAAIKTVDTVANGMTTGVTEGVNGVATGVATGVASGVTGVTDGVAKGVASGVDGVAGAGFRGASRGVPLNVATPLRVAAGIPRISTPLPGDSSAGPVPGLPVFGRRRKMREEGEEGKKNAAAKKQEQCAATGQGTPVALNNASAAFYFLCPAGKGHCSDGTCVFGRTAPVKKGEWAKCMPLHSCRSVEFDVSGCFPAAATVRLPGGASKRMSELRVGDKVLAAGPGGKLGYQDVYFFGHRAEGATARFVRIEFGGGSKALELTPDHFVPVLPPGAAPAGPEALSRARMTYARDVREGDVMLVESAGRLRAAAVTSTAEVWRTGLFNPYTMGGSVVVDGVLASSHSSWLVDGIAARMGVSHLLPSFFQALFAPLRALYAAAGPAFMEVFGDALAAGALRLEAVLTAPDGPLTAAAAAAGPKVAAAAAVAAVAGGLAAALKQQQGRPGSRS